MGIGDVFPEITGKLVAFDEAGTGKPDVHEAKDIRPGQTPDPIIHNIEKAGGKSTGHHGAHGGAADQLDLYPRFLQSLDHPDMGPASRRAAPQGNTDSL